jgi:phage host-nuclease inhibitor protein Gam
MKTPKNREEAEQLIAHLGQLNMELALAEGTKTKQINSAWDTFRKSTDGIAEEIAEETAAVRAWAEKGRDELCPKGSKTATLLTGELKWRLNPEKLIYPKGEAAVIAALKEGNFRHFITVREYVNSSALLEADREKVLAALPVQLEQTESFIVKPLGAKS